VQETIHLIKGGEREWNHRGVVLQSILKERKSISATQNNTPGVGD